MSVGTKLLLALSVRIVLEAREGVGGVAVGGFQLADVLFGGAVFDEAYLLFEFIDHILIN
jgi:hypothetical protein